MKKEIFWSIAFAMIFLIVTIPFYVADAYGQGQDVSTIGRIIYPTPTGVSNASGFMMSSDSLTILVNLRAKTIPAADVANNVFVEMGGATYNFTNCSSLGSSWYDCVFQKTLVDMPGGSYQGSITLNAPDCASCDVPLSLSVDALPPSFSQLTFTPQKTNRQNITVSYIGSDKICPTCGDKCSGIKNVIIYPSNDYSKILANIFVNQSPNAPSGCAEARVLNNVSISSLSSGNYSICIAGLDNAGNINIVNATCSNLVVAREPPAIETPVIKDEGGELLTFVSGNGVLAKISTVITSPYADLTKATVDLSVFQLGSEDLNCLNINNSRRWNCTKQFFMLLNPSLATQTVPITVYDDAGNVKKQDFVYGLKTDSNAPTLASFRTNYVFGNMSFFGPSKNKIYLTLNELQSGFTKNFTYITGLENYFNVPTGAGITKYQAGCQQSGTVWECSWPEINLKSTTSDRAVLGFEIYDDMNNRLEFAKEVPIDVEPPRIVDLEMHTQNNYAAIGVGQNAVLRANITEFSGMVSGDFKIYADLTMIEGGSGMRKADSCELINSSYIQGVSYNGSNWVCSWIIRNVRETGLWKPVINATDVAGNQKDYYDYPALYIAYLNPQTGNLSYQTVSSFTTFGVETNVSDYWSVQAGTPSPGALDRQMLAVIEPYVYVPLVFTPLQGSPQIVQVTLEGCQNDGTAVEINLFPNIPTASNMEFRVLNGNYGTTESLRYACQIGIVSIANNQLTQKELENVTIGVALYKLPLGKFDKEVKNKVEWVYKLVNGDLAKTIGILNYAIGWMKWLCGLWAFIGTTLTGYYTYQVALQDTLTGCKATLVLIPVCAPLSDAGKAISRRVQDAQAALGSKVMEPMCKFTTCKMEKTAGNQTTWQGVYQNIIKTMNPKVSTFFTDLGQPGKTQPPKSAAAGAPTSPAATEFITGSATTSSSASGKTADTFKVLADKTIQFWPSDMTQSIVLSTIFLCLPGVVYNLEKYRQILCNYGMCMLQTAQNGGPLKGCEEMKAMQTCIAVMGEIFAVVPYLTVFKNVKAFLQSVLNDPFSFAFFAVGVGCKLMPEPSTEEFCRATNALINILGWVTKAFGVYQDLSNKIKAGEDTFKSQDLCKSFIMTYEEVKVKPKYKD